MSNETPRGGEHIPEHLWKRALLEALDETVFETMHVGDAETPAEAREHIEWDLREGFTSLGIERVADVFEEKLTAYVEAQEER